MQKWRNVVDLELEKPSYHYSLVIVISLLPARNSITSGYWIPRRYSKVERRHLIPGVTMLKASPA